MTRLKHCARYFVNVYFFICCVHLVSTQSTDGLQYLQILFRHGDRSPIRLYPNDPNPESFWTEGLGMLTKLGRQQHYQLGKYFHNRYEDFISTSPVEVDVLSSDVDRCLKSALANLATFYRPSPEWEFEKGFEWQPITILYYPKDEDRYLESDSYCPRAFEEKNKILSSPKAQEIIKQYKGLFKNLTDFSGTDIENWIDASYLFDVLKIEKKYNLSIPSWATENWEQLHHISDMSFYWTYDSELMLRLRAGPLIGKILKNMKNKIMGKIPEKKVQIYSSHDTNVALVMQALNVANWKAPPYCSSLLFELHRKNESYFVRIYFSNSTAPEKEIEDPHVLTLEGCTEFCPLEYFANYTAHIIPQDWDAECKLDPTFFETISKTRKR